MIRNQSRKYFRMRKDVQDRYCPVCKHVKETCRITRGRPRYSCDCTGPCGCMICVDCNRVPCICGTIFADR